MIYQHVKPYKTRHQGNQQFIGKLDEMNIWNLYQNRYYK